LSTSALYPASTNGDLPIAASTPNFQNGHKPRGRNRSARSETSSVPPNPTARLLHFKSPERAACSNSSALVPNHESPEATSTTATSFLAPVATHESSFNPSDRYNTANSTMVTNGDTFSPSAFEMISSSASAASQEMDRNSSFEVLSASHIESFGISKDSNHNKNGDPANRYVVPA